MTAVDRILQFIEKKGITKYEFHKKNDFSNGFLDKSRAIGTDKCAKILENYPEINPEWLVTGNGNMLRDEGTISLPILEEKHVKETNIEREYRKIMRKLKFADGISLAKEGAPFYPLPVSAGNATQLLDEVEKPTGFLSIPGVNCKAYFPVIGFSFEPLIKAGDIIGIDFIDNWERLDPDSIYFIITQDNRMIKRLVDDPEDADRIICLSPNFREFRIWKEEIKAIHKVIFFGRLV